ncbi:MAG: hypothetical protein EZS28_034615 [Streblomastix strix]|uniref:Uncharacterized protein n=1 Tax=Streblomastix strix TaxID=222440 RepID=A0A5J4UGP7_9EUKA|nr:MAG: hypothetical protein EZS28_034615 [Streblomastix strix]
MEKTVSHKPLISLNPLRQSQLKVYTANQIGVIHQMEDNDEFQDHMENMMNNQERIADDDQANILRQKIQSRYTPQEQEIMKINDEFGMRLPDIFENQINEELMKRHQKATHIETVWNFNNSGRHKKITPGQFNKKQPKQGFVHENALRQKNYFNNSGQIQIKPLNKDSGFKQGKRRGGKKSSKKNQTNYSNIQSKDLLGSHQVGQQSFTGYQQLPGETYDWAKTYSFMRSPIDREQEVTPLAITNSFAQTTNHPNQNSSPMLVADQVGLNGYTTTIPQGSQHQGNAEEAAQDHHAHQGTLTLDEGVMQAVSSTQGLASGTIEMNNAITIEEWEASLIDSSEVSNGVAPARKGRGRGRGRGKTITITALTVTSVIPSDVGEEQQR